jgi:hypothetical protein
MSKKIYAILLNDQLSPRLEQALGPYLKNGTIGKFIEGTKVQQVDSFLQVTVTKELAGGSIADDMRISIPVRYIEFFAEGDSSPIAGFLPAEE